MHTTLAALDIRFHRSKTRSKQNGVPFSITRQDLMDLWVVQKGLCYYSNLPMTAENSHQCRDPYAVSIDRITPAKGYVKDNIALCCWGSTWPKVTSHLKTSSAYTHMSQTTMRP